MNLVLIGFVGLGALLFQLGALAESRATTARLQSIEKWQIAKEDANADFAGLELPLESEYSLHFRPAAWPGGSIEAHKREQLVRTLEIPRGFPENFNQFAIDQKHHKLVLFRFGEAPSLEAHSYENSESTICPLEKIEPSPYSRVLASEGRSFLFVPTEKTISVYRFSTVKGCEAEKVADIPSDIPDNFRAILNGRGFTVFYGQRISAQSKDVYLKTISFSVGGEELSATKFPDLILDLPSDSVYAGPTSLKEGFLILAKQKGNSRNGLVLVKENGDYKSVDAFSTDAVKLSTGDLIFRRGRHADSSELLIVDENKLSIKGRINHPTGYQRGIMALANGALTFVQYRSDSSIRRMTFLGPKRKAPKVDEIGYEPTPPDFPVAEEVAYSQSEGKIPAILLKPVELRNCRSDRKVPGVVYFHGGSFETIAAGHYRQDHDPLSLAALGYVVLDANYFGNIFAGQDYAASSVRSLVEERAKPQLRSIRAAAHYLAQLPCVDPKKIFFFGHSYGAVLGGIYFTDSAEEKLSPYAGAILKSGYYTTDMNAVLLFPNKPSAALAASRKLETDCFTASEGCPGCANDALNRLVPKASGGYESREVEKFCTTMMDDLIADQRVQSVHKKVKLFVVNAEEDGATSARAWMRKLTPYNSLVTTWFPTAEAGHVFRGTSHVDMLLKTQSFIEDQPVHGR